MLQTKEELSLFLPNLKIECDKQESSILNLEEFLQTDMANKM